MVVIYKFIKLVKFRAQVYSQYQKNQRKIKKSNGEKVQLEEAEEETATRDFPK